MDAVAGRRRSSVELDVLQIMDLMPHRYPFLMIEQV
jgi:3-hydroxymyristoyl/3-hydroxydecanoyl-(acyl carrier protein) dehydratase